MTIVTPVSLKNVKVSAVKPYTRTKHPATIEASLFDLICIDAYVPIIFVYKPEEGQKADAFSDLVVELKESLSKVLVPYFPMAGSWVKTYNAKIRELECNDEGVTFIEASMDAKLESVVRLKDFEAIEILAGHQFVGLDAKVFSQDVETPLPSLFVQVTQFKCGSVVLNATFCHMTVDGKGMYAFMEAWSEIALQGQTSIIPVHDRSLATSLAEFTKFATGDAGGEEVVEPENVSEKKSDGKTKRVDPGLAFRFPWGTTSSKTLHVRRQAIEDLKREAAQQSVQVTMVDLITAHFWRSINKMPESMDEKTSSVVATSVEGRSRFHDPPLPERYSGNVLLTVCTPQVAASDLAAGNSPLFAAKIVHNGVRDVKPSNWQSCVLRLMGQLEDYPKLKYRILVVTSWFRFPMYEINFGHGFGKPVLATANWFLGTMPYGAAIVLPPPPSLAETAIASVQLVTTSDDVAQALFSDEQFLSFFLPFH